MNAPEPRWYAFGEFRIDTVARQLSRRDGTPVALTARVFETLLYLVRHPGASLGKDELLAAIWPGRVIEENNLTQSISTLRKVLGGEADGHRYIVTEPGRGYRFVADVQTGFEAVSGTDARSSAALVKFLSELDRRNVIRVAGLYLVGAWLLTQVAATVLPLFDTPGWALRALVILLVLSFVPTLIIAWVFELTPQGFKRDEEVLPEESIAPQTARRMSRALIIVLACALVYFAFDRFVLAPRRESAPDVAAEHRSAVKSGEAGNGRSIAVLPFGNLSADAENAYFASGIENEILTRLAKIGALKVISRTSTQQYASKPGNLAEIARQLDVANILEGSVQKAGNSVRINVQLIRVDDDSHLWAETYDRQLDNIFGVESEVAAAIADSLQANLTGSEQRALAMQPTDNAAAYDAYLRGRAVEASGNRHDDWRRAAAAYAAAVKLDPRFALAWAHLASIRTFLYFEGLDLAENTPDAIKQAVDTALRLQSDLGEAWLAQGNYRYRVLLDFPGALQTLEEARKRLPNNAQLFEAIAFVERRMGRWEETLTAMQQAVQLDPSSLTLLYAQADALREMRRFAKTHAVLDRAMLIAPNNTQSIAAKAKTYLDEGRVDDAATLLEPLALDPNDNIVFPAKIDLLWAQRRFDALIATLQDTLPDSGEPLTDEQVLAAVNLGYAQLCVGRAAAGRSVFERVVRTLKPTSHATVRLDGSGLSILLALAYAGLADKQAALDQAHEAITLYRDDAPMEAWAEVTLAQIQSLLGDNDEAIAALPHLLQMPHGLNPADLHDAPWDPLRKDPRFQRLLSDSEKSTSAKP